MKSYFEISILLKPLKNKLQPNDKMLEFVNKDCLSKHLVDLLTEQECLTVRYDCKRLDNYNNSEDGWRELLLPKKFRLGVG